jgi:hypothetical protein
LEHPAELVLGIRRRDRLQAMEFAAELALALAERSSDRRLGAAEPSPERRLGEPDPSSDRRLRDASSPTLPAGES